MNMKRPEIPAEQKYDDLKDENGNMTMDGHRWAKEYCRMFPGNDEGLMIAWFCNAIMAGFDEANRRKGASHEST